MQDIESLEKLYESIHTNAKQISIWYNQSGLDEIYAQTVDDFTVQTVKRLLNSVKFCKGVPVRSFELELKGTGWVMYEFDGIGLFVVDKGVNIYQAKEDYDRRSGHLD